jgi:hypothetical protein
MFETFNPSFGGSTIHTFNMTAFTGPPHFPTDPRDGTSNTIAFSERYFERYFSPEPLQALSDHYDLSWLMYDENNPALPGPVPPLPLHNRGVRRPSFADPGWVDVVPVTTGGPPVTRPSTPGVTVQAEPHPQDASPFIPQTPFSGGVRVTRPGVTPEVFWALVTPAGGEVVTDY